MSGRVVGTRSGYERSNFESEQMTDDRRTRSLNHDDPTELHTEADDEATLSRDEAKVAGMVKTDIVYGDSSFEPNADDQNDLHHAEPDEHF